jgi:FkbM family methyltransferase
MAKVFKSLLRRTLFAKQDNLLSMDDPYETMARLMRPHHVSHVLDAGASHGRVSRRLLRIFPDAHAYAFEPHPMYRERLDHYAGEEPRFHPQFLALSDREGSIDLHITESPGITSLFKPSRRLQNMYPEESAEKEVVQVDMTTIDSWAAVNDVPALQVMKFDIQGGELQALRGAQQALTSSTLMVYTEILFNPLYEGGALYSDIDQCLREYGFLLYNIYKPKCDENGALMWANAIFLHAERMKL